METLLQDFRYGWRMLGKNPAFTAIAVLTLALGIGANSALFSVVNGVLLNPLPYHRPAQLFYLYSKTPQFGQASVSYPNFLDWREQSRTFASMAAFRGTDFNLTGMGDAQRLHGHMISAGLFATLGVSPLLGREFSPDEDRVGAAPVVLLGDGMWKSKFAASKDVLGRALTIDGTTYTIIGVVPEHIVGLEDSDVYIPLGQWNDPTFLDRRIGMGTNVIGRLKPGVTAQQADADVQGIAHHLQELYPEADGGSSIALVSMKDDVIGDVGPYLLLLLAAVGFVLLIACANIANLLLARSTGRAREFAIRTALGANRSRLVRQLLSESVLLAMLGGVLGFALAQWGTQFALKLVPTALPRADEIGLDFHVLLFTVGISLLAGILFGLAPAWKTATADVHGTLKEGGRGVISSRHLTQMTLVASETALAVILLVGAGLMIRSLAAMWHSDLGFDPTNVLTFSMASVPQKDVNAAQIRAQNRELVDRLAAVPGVISVAQVAGSLPMRGDSELPFWLEGHPKPAKDSDMNWALFYGITPDYFKSMGITLVRGRQFTPIDNEKAPGVAIIDEELARKFFPNEDPIGKHMNFGLLNMHAEIVGIVRHVNHWGFGANHPGHIQNEVYLPWVQFPDQVMPLIARGMDFTARTSVPPDAIVGPFRAALRQFDPNQVVYNFQPMEQVVSNSIATQRFTMILLGIFAGLALLLASVGIYGVLSYFVGQRIQEVGIRMALGAQRGDVLRLILGEGTRMALIGVAIGLAAAFALTRLMSSMLYGVSARDPLTFSAVALFLTGIAIAACYIPAHRATKVDPMVALRYE